eukprot:CAMPEP_0172586568 /NCGR_PEP_ID=MMETSP1068-20121228/5925_1 /TAXON_ID=35684 /ORGANISM="Pseudopedinella elastica, Strain CCMP716" /LENGTH=268 /DNA_ID=CAMNT_0013381419 /DNA_START=52 /DNA_END=858 /DNA_ORIENTATION=+
MTVVARIGVALALLCANAAALSMRPRMSIAVFGGSGGVGSEAVFQGLKKGSVTTLVRNKAKLVIPPGSGGADAGKPLEGANVVVGDVTKQEDVDKVFEGQDVTGVIIALGGKTKDVGPTMCTDGTTCVINAMKKYGVKRIAVVTSIGAGDSEKQAPFVFKILMNTVMRSIFADKNSQEALFSSGPGKDLEFTVVRPGGLTLEAPNGIINIVDGEAGSITRADVADFCLTAVSEEDFPFVGRFPCISSDKGTSWTKDRSVKTQGARSSA